MYALHPHIDFTTDHIPDLNNLISLAKSLMCYFWPDYHYLERPGSPIKEDLRDLMKNHYYHIKGDIGAFCYVFSILLQLASDQNIVRQKKEMEYITSRMLEILNWKENREISVESTGVTYKQRYWASQALEDYQSLGVVHRGLVPRLKDQNHLDRSN